MRTDLRRRLNALERDAMMRGSRGRAPRVLVLTDGMRADGSVPTLEELQDADGLVDVHIVRPGDVVDQDGPHSAYRPYRPAEVYQELCEMARERELRHSIQEQEAGVPASAAPVRIPEATIEEADEEQADAGGAKHERPPAPGAPREVAIAPPSKTSPLGLDLSRY